MSLTDARLGKREAFHVCFPSNIFVSFLIYKKEKERKRKKTETTIKTATSLSYFEGVLFCFAVVKERSAISEQHLSTFDDF